MNQLTLDELMTARDRCAQIIAQYGSRYLPIFERLENEIALLVQKQILLDRALSLSNIYGTQNGTPNGTQFQRGEIMLCEKFNKNSGLLTD